MESIVNVVAEALNASSSDAVNAASFIITLPVNDFAGKFNAMPRSYCVTSYDAMRGSPPFMSVGGRTMQRARIKNLEATDVMTRMDRIPSWFSVRDAPHRPLPAE